MAAAAAAPADEAFVELWQDFLERDAMRFRAMHQRARADAGPSLMGGARGIDHWTYDYVRRAVDACLREGSTVIVEYARQCGGDVATLASAARPALQAHLDAMMAELQRELDAPPANEFSVRPSAEALTQVRHYVRDRVDGAFRALARGRIDERLELAGGPISKALRNIGWGPRWPLYIAIALVALALWTAL